MKKASCFVFVLAICLLVGCAENREDDVVTSSEAIQTTEVSETEETPEDYYMLATSFSAKEVESFALEIKNNILEGDWMALSEKISYPITLSGININDSSAFSEMNIDNIISQEFVTAIEEESCQQMFCNCQGISMGNVGQIWIGGVIDESKNEKLKIIGINGMLSESARDTELLDRFYHETYGEDLYSENMEKRVLNRGGGYHNSCYYEEITHYWEGIRGVTDIANILQPLYLTDMRYYTEEEFANDTPVAIHLAKNEIYARRGYIFKSEDLNNYFLGCAWYTPLYTGEEFDNSVFNDYERKNLEILAKLDADFELTASNNSVVNNEMVQNKLTVEEAWEILKENYTFLRTANLEEVGYDEYGNFQVVVDRGYWTWSEEETERLCESLIFFNCEEDTCYQFGHYYVYYEEDEETVFATQTKGWYEVDFYTGQVSRW